MSATTALRPVRESRALYVMPHAQFSRRCAECGTDFLATEGGAPERGPWRDWKWFCSTECRGSEEP